MADSNPSSASTASAAKTRIGTPTPRYDGRLKVTGAARYASDQPVANPAYGYLHVSGIAKGRIRRIDERAARAVPGVLDIFTWRNIGRIEPGKLFADKGHMGTPIAPLRERI